uniref:Uncharacterized protein n=1 Tax=Oryza brachyantha TaxID=4533 RepID=J3N7Y0_ORYBR
MVAMAVAEVEAYVSTKLVATTLVHIISNGLILLPVTGKVFGHRSVVTDDIEAPVTGKDLSKGYASAALGKVAVFALVQALVYHIIRKSSGVFSMERRELTRARSISFRPMRSMSVRRFLAALSDDPVGVTKDDSLSAP